MQSYSIKRQHNGLLSFKKGHFSVKLLKIRFYYCSQTIGILSPYPFAENENGL